MSFMFLVNSLRFTVLKLIEASVEFGSDVPRSCVLHHNFPNAAFVAVGSDGSSSKHKVVDFVDERVGSAGVNVFAVSGAMLVD
jgi:hypothetical protein